MTSVAALVRRAPGPAAFLLAATAVFTTVGLVRGIGFLWIYLPALVASIAIVVAIDRRRGPIPTGLLWLLVIWAAAHLAGGLAANPTGKTEILYGMWLIDGALRYDQLVHGFGIAGAVATLAYAARGTRHPRMWGFALGQTVGLVNETAENIFAQFIEGSNVGDAVNTAWDLGWHAIGGAVAWAWMAWRRFPTAGGRTFR